MIPDELVKPTPAELAERYGEPTVTTQVWVQDPDSPYLKLDRIKSIDEVRDELVAIVGEYPDGGEEGLHVFPSIDGEAPWPKGQIAVFSVRGSSEGDYLHVEVLGDLTRRLILISKTFQGREAAWGFARRIADLLAV
jgi:hypothetical protein